MQAISVRDEVRLVRVHECWVCHTRITADTADSSPHRGDLVLDLEHAPAVVRSRPFRAPADSQMTDGLLALRDRLNDRGYAEKTQRIHLQSDQISGREDRQVHGVRGCHHGQGFTARKGRYWLHKGVVARDVGSPLHASLHAWFVSAPLN
jgi:hypothetical protein